MEETDCFAAATKTLPEHQCPLRSKALCAVPATSWQLAYFIGNHKLLSQANSCLQSVVIVGES